MSSTTFGPLADLVARCIIAFERDGDAGVDAELATQPDLAAAAREQMAALRQAGLLVPPVPPAAIGPYRVVRRLGSGGMGTVWLCEQQAPLQRLVAIKVMRPGFDHAELLARFQLERAALTTLDDPCIARILDAGVTDDHRPYLVMDYVAGTTITAYGDERCLDLRARLRLFARVCAAVQHAHHKGIVHRDLKPSNILVVEREGAPAPVIIDFGVAKPVSPSRDSTQFTLPGRLIGTPEYMSPEQARGSGDVDTRTDVYSLGVLLHELLTGQLPIPTDRFTSLGDVARVVGEFEPPPPSRVVASLPAAAAAAVAAARGLGARELHHALRHDLDWITSRALAKDRERRYSTPAEFALDVQRHLQGHPVAAGPPSPWYDLRKFVARHRLGVAAGAVAAAALIAATTTSLSFWRQAEAAALVTATANERLERGLDRALAALDRMVQFGADGLRTRANEAMGRSLLRTALELHEQWIAADAGGARDLRLTTALATTMGRAAELHQLLGERREADDLLQRGEQLLHAGGAALPGRPALGLGQAHQALGRVAKGAGEPARAVAHFRAAATAFAAADHASAVPHQIRHWRIAALRELADTLSESDIDGALRHFLEVQPLAEQQLRDPAATQVERAAALQGLVRLAWLHCELGSGDAAALLQHTLGAVEALHAQHTDLGDRLLLQPVLLQMMSSLFRMARFDMTRRALDLLEITTRLAQVAEPGVTTHGATLGRVLHYRVLLAETDLPSQSFLVLERGALAQDREAITAADHLPELALHQFGHVATAAARRIEWLDLDPGLRRDENLAEAAALLAEAQAIWARLPASLRAGRHPQEMHLRLFEIAGGLARHQGDRTSAVAHLRQAIAGCDEILREHPDVLQVRLMRTGFAHVLLGDLGGVQEAGAASLVDAVMADFAHLMPRHQRPQNWGRLWNRLNVWLPALERHAARLTPPAAAGFAASLLALAPPADLHAAGRADVLAAVLTILRRAVGDGLDRQRLHGADLAPLRGEAPFEQLLGGG